MVGCGQAPDCRLIGIFPARFLPSGTTRRGEDEDLVPKPIGRPNSLRSQSRPNFMPYIADPSIRSCTHAITREAIEAVAADLMRGMNFFVARDRAIETRANEWVSRYGRECADKALGALHMLQASEFLSADEKRLLRARQDESARIQLRIGGVHRDTWWNRLSIRLWGVPFAVLALALLLPAAMPSSVLAASGQSVAPRFPTLDACGVSEPWPGRDRACRQFNSADRAIFRNYDGPGAGAPRD